MQHEKDYIEREIKQLSNFLKQIISLILSGEKYKSLQGLEQIDLEIIDRVDFSIRELIEMNLLDFYCEIEILDNLIIENLLELFVAIKKNVHLSANRKTLIDQKIVQMIDFLDENSRTFSIERFNLKKEILE